MTIAEICVKRPIFALMLIGFLLVLGIFSFRDLGVDLFPRTDPATVSVIVNLPGALPEEITTQVVLPLEDAISSVSGLDEMTAQIVEGSVRITCVFLLERDTEGAAQDIREKVSGAIHNLPPNVLPPIIQKVDPDSDPVMSIVVASEASLREITEIADKIVARSLETVDGVGEMEIVGGHPRVIRVFADATKLNAYGITIDRLERAIQSENADVPGGTMVRGEVQAGVRSLGRLTSVDQFGQIIVANVNGAPIRVNDLGRVEDGIPEPTTWNLLQGREGAGKEAVGIDITRQSGTNTLEVVERIKAKLVEIKKRLPPGTTIQTIRDSSVFIKASVTSLEEHLLWGSLLASLVVLLFIGNLRSVLIASIAIPTSIIATFTLLKAMDFTLNNMTLLALTLAVGIVIDDAIVVLENIVRYIEEKGREPKEAAIEATKEITLAVLATTLSLVIIFLPIAFITGYAKRYLNQFGWTMAIAVLVSMLVSFTLTPMLSSRLLRRAGEGPANGAPRGGHPTKGSRYFSRLNHAYGRLLEWALDHRVLVVILAVLTFALTFPLNQRVGRDFIPADDQSELWAYTDFPVGTSVSGTARIASEMAKKIVRLPGVEFANAFVQPPPMGRSNHFHLYVKLVDVSKRDLSFQDIAAEVRQVLGTFKGTRFKVSPPSALGGGEVYGAIRPAIVGPDYPKAIDLAAEASARIATLPGLVDVIADININSPEYQIQLDRRRAADLGVRSSDFGSALRLMMAGTDQISTYKEGAEQYDVTVQLLPEQQKNPEILAGLMIPSSKVGQVRLDNIATIQRGFGPVRIDRYNRQFQVTMSANNVPDFPLDQALRAIDAKIKEVPMPAGYSYKFQGTAKLLEETTRNLILALLLASIFMYIVLAAQFESLVHPFTIMLSLPLSIPFALLSLWVTHRTLNLWSALGVLLLLGIVKKNGILQVDYTNKLREQGLPLRDAILQANRIRLRPILMTTFSIVAGLIPTALGIGAGAAQRSAIAVTIIGGQMLCLLPTLLLTPVAYSLLEELSARRIVEQTQAGLSRLRLSLARMLSL
jgi:hydrophobe/amphiphile efflux-1 (HAE1) family protein